jgi:hypothetical protein
MNNKISIKITFILFISILFGFSYFLNKEKSVFKNQNYIGRSTNINLTLDTNKKIIGIISPNDCNTCYSLLINELNNLTLNPKLKDKIIIYINSKKNFKTFQQIIMMRNRPRFPLKKLDIQNFSLLNLTLKFNTPILLVHKYRNNYTLYQVDLLNQKILFQIMDKLNHS